MKWITKNYKGKKQVWYSGDVIDKIVLECEEQMCEKDDCDHECKCLPKIILDILEDEEK